MSVSEEEEAEAEVQAEGTSRTLICVVSGTKMVYLTKMPLIIACNFYELSYDTEISIVINHFKKKNCN